MTMPAIATAGRRSPKKIRPRTATQTGSSAMRIAAMPAGTVFSPRATMPIPPKRRSPPTIAESRHSRRVGSRGRSASATVASRRIRQAAKTSQARRSVPAMRNRVAAIRNGGMDSTLTRIPMYVEPHTK